MFPTPQNYAIWPSVAPADTTVQLTITANERAFVFQEGAPYQVVITAVDSDENYYAPFAQTKIDVVASQGVLAFSYDFVGEQEYTVFLKKDDLLIATFRLFSLYEDLYALAPLKGDLHSHSCRSDGTRDAAAQAGYYRESGFDFVALTDHNRYYGGGEIDEVYAGVNTGLTRVLGEEVHCPGSVVHIVHVGGGKSVAERYVHDRENYEKEIETYLLKVPNHVPAAFKERYAKAMWATDAIHAAGGLAIFPHPFWRPGPSKAYNVCPVLAVVLLQSGLFVAYEVLGGMGSTENNHSVALWGDLRAEGLKIPVVGSSDAHRLEKDAAFSHLFTICFAAENTNEAIIAAVKQGNCVAVEATETENGVQYRCYGSCRLVAYAHFLLENFFPHYQHRCIGTGVAMRAYAMNECGAELVEQNAALCQVFRNRFFGKTAAAYPAKEIFDFEDKWRAVQLNGPKTRGSSVDATPAKTLI